VKGWATLVSRRDAGRGGPRVRPHWPTVHSFDSLGDRVAGSSANDPWISLNAPLIAMPNTPCRLEQVDDLLGGAALVHGRAVGDQRHRGEVVLTPLAQRLDGLADVLQETPASSSRLTTLSTTMSRNE
jgi:hypothetical protein